MSERSVNGAVASSARSTRHSVVLVDEDDFEISVTRRGVPTDGQACQLTISVNGEQAVSFLEEAGPAAPLSATIALTMPSQDASAVLGAMRTRPWQHDDFPVIPFAVEAPAKAAAKSEKGPRGTVAYLVNNRPIGDVIETIRATLDLSRPLP